MTQASLLGEPLVRGLPVARGECIGLDRKHGPKMTSVPTCGAKPGQKCELSTGLPRTEPHRDRRLAAAEK